MKERFGAKDPKSWQLRFHAQTAGSSLQAQQPLVNVVRTTVQALAAMLGGAQSLHTNGFDEALALPTEASARLALRTQQVLAHETRRRRHRRSARRRLRRRGAHARDREARRGAHRAHRRAGRHGRGHRAGLAAARDRAARLRVPARHRDQGEDHRRRQRVPGRRGAADGPACASTPRSRREQAARVARVAGSGATGKKRPRRPGR